MIYPLGRVDASEEMPWKRYLTAVLAFNVVGFLSLFALLVGQARLPANPQKFAGPGWLNRVENVSANGAQRRYSC
jgi:K+-transporting ATPase ATPase A chain